MTSIISRGGWGARPPRNRATCAWTGRTLWVHHSDGPAPTDSRASEIATVRGIQAFHQGPQRGWADIGYAFLVAPSGRVYEGRGVQVWAAHCPGHNDEPSVCLMGTYDATPPSEAAREAVWWLADHLGMTDLNGHRQGTATSCPGDATMRTLVDAPRPPKTSQEDRSPVLPHGASLRLHLRTLGEERAGKGGRAWAGWGECAGALRWIARHGLAPTTTAAISWRGDTWRGPRDVTNVAKNLTTRYL